MEGKSDLFPLDSSVRHALFVRDSGARRAGGGWPATELVLRRLDRPKPDVPGTVRAPRGDLMHGRRGDLSGRRTCRRVNGWQSIIITVDRSGGNCQPATTIGNGLGGGAAFGEESSRPTPLAYRSLVQVFDAINHT